jgi:hypothetical protein
MRQARDATLAAPRLLFPSVQVNIDAGRLPAPRANGHRYLVIPLNVLRPASELGEPRSRARPRCRPRRATSTTCCGGPSPTCRPTLVVLAHRLTGGHAPLLGSRAEKLLHHADCPVLVVPIVEA